MSYSLRRKRFDEDGAPGLGSRHVGSEPSVLTSALRAGIIRPALDRPGDGSTPWSCRTPNTAMGLGKSLVHRMLQEADLIPHPPEEAKAADIIGLYMHPPQKATVFCVDERTAIPALDRLDPVLPLSPRRFERHGFENFRHGTLSLYAALNTGAGLRQTSASSWLSQVEIGFSKIERDLVADGIFTPVQDPARQIGRYIRQYAKRAKPIRWQYTDPRRHCRA